MATLTAEAIEVGLREHKGNMAALGRSLGVTRQAVHAFIEKRDKLRAVKEECRESMIDDAEGALHKAVLAGEAWAVCFFLKTQGKKRGYVERQELTGADAGPIQVIRGVNESEVLGASDPQP